MTNFFWYLLSSLFGFVGYVMVANSLAYENKKVIKKSLYLASISTAVYFVLFILYVITFSQSND